MDEVFDFEMDPNHPGSWRVFRAADRAVVYAGESFSRCEVVKQRLNGGSACEWWTELDEVVASIRRRLSKNEQQNSNDKEN